MQGPGQQNDFSMRAKAMDGNSIPCQYDNINYGKKRKAKAHKYSIISTGTGKFYGSKTIMETFSEYLIRTHIST